MRKLIQLRNAGNPVPGFWLDLDPRILTGSYQGSRSVPILNAKWDSVMMRFASLSFSRGLIRNSICFLSEV
jgi:hypothetical protein